MINKVLDKLGVRDPVYLGEWEEEEVKALVEAFLSVRFPTILLLNKADQVKRMESVVRFKKRDRLGKW
jgi:hypothetical protein